MRKFLLAALAFLSLGLQPAPATAQRAAPALGWESIGPPGGDVADVVSAPGNANRLYAVIKSNHGQVFTSTDAGLSWSRLAVFSEPAYSLAIDPSNAAVMYVLGRTSVMKSSDGGSNWTRTQLGSYCGGENGEIAVHPLDPDLVLATGYAYYNAPASWETAVAFFRSADGGASWSVAPVKTGCSGGQGLGLAINPQILGEVFIGGYEYDLSMSSGRVYKTTDGGSSWTDVSGPCSSYQVRSIILDPGNPARVFAGTPWFVFRSLDGGLTWSPNHGQAFANELAFDTLNAGILYAGWTKGVYRSTDGGVTWVFLPSGSTGDCQSLHASGANIYYGSETGLFRSGDAGTTWQSSQSGLNAASIQSLAVSPCWPSLVYATAGARLFKSTDFGEIWGEPPYVFSLGTVGQIAADPSDPDTLYAVRKGCGSG